MRGVPLIGLILTAVVLVAGLGYGARRVLDDPPEPTAARACPAVPAPARVPRAPAPAPGTWQALPDSPVARAELSAAALGNRVLLLGGQGPRGVSQSLVHAYDPRRRRYESLPPMPARVDHALVAADGENLYVVGGYRDGNPLADAWRYHASTGRWQALPRMPTARGGLAGGIVAGRLVAAGGAGRSFPDENVVPFDTVEVLDLQTLRWRSAPPLPDARHHAASAVLDGEVHVIGGRRPHDFDRADVHRYDPRSQRWAAAPPLPLGVSGAAAASTGDAIVVTGGGDPTLWESKGKGWTTPATWRLRAGATRWDRLPDTRVPHHQGAAAAVGGRVYVFEGSSCPGFGRGSAAESLAVAGT